MNKTYNGTRYRLNGSSRVVADGSTLLAIKYIGSQAAATVTVASGDITLKHGASGSEAVDTTVGASGVVADGTYTTIGAMADAINLSPNWRAEVVDALRADSSTAALLARSETRIYRTSALLPLFGDSSAALHLSYRISARRLNFYRSQKKAGQGGPFQSVIRNAQARVNTGSGTLTLALYQVTADASNTATLLASKTAADDTATDLFATTLQDGIVRSDFGTDLLVRISGSGDFPDSGAYLETLGFVE